MLRLVMLRSYRRRKAEKRLKEDRYILSLDGGGMRGVIPATMLGHIESLFHELGDHRPLYSHFDLIAGTSTGGLIALALSNPNEVSLEPKEIVNLYLDHGPSIFPKGSPLLPLNVLGQLFSQKYDDLSFNTLLEELFGETPLSETLTPTMLVTYDYTNNRPHILSSYATPKTLMRQAARATSAAPTYFAPTTVYDEGSATDISLIDGGVVANNPVLYAYREAKKLYPDAKRFHILSLSTAGVIPVKRDPNKVLNGVIGWLDPSRGTPIYKVYATSQMQTSDEIANAIDDLEYVRIDGALEKRVKLDETDPLVLGEMIERANQIYFENRERLKSFCLPLTQRVINSRGIA